MITSNTEETTQATVTEPKATKKARVRDKGAHVAPAKGKPGKTATSAKKAARPAKKAPTKAAAKAKGTREGSKTAQVLELIKRPGGATLQELMAATEWQPHSIRGFISGTLGKKLGLSVESAKSEEGKRTYSLRVDLLRIGSLPPLGLGSGGFPSAHTRPAAAAIPPPNRSRLGRVPEGPDARRESALRCSRSRRGTD